VFGVRANRTIKQRNDFRMWTVLLARPAISHQAHSSAP
jgi:hypothetical protein